MKIETERLQLIPLTPSQLERWIKDISSLEKELNVIYKAEPITGFFLEIVRRQLAITLKYPENYVWHSFWFLIRKRDRVVVGSADFKNIPNDSREVEIGYGLGKEFEPYKPFTKNEAYEEAKRRTDDENFLAVCLKNGKLIGNLYFSKGDFQTWEIGYVFNEKYWGNGYASESLLALMKYAFLSLNVRRIIAQCDPKNIRSWKLLERIGMRREGKFNAITYQHSLNLS